jgi:hypothetical protein
VELNLPKLDKLKEELGWLKVIFAIAVATNLSLMAYLAQNYKTQDLLFSIINGVSIILVTIIIVIINKKAYKKIDEIGEL